MSLLVYLSAVAAAAAVAQGWLWLLFYDPCLVKSVLILIIWFVGEPTYLFILVCDFCSDQLLSMFSASSECGWMGC